MSHLEHAKALVGALETAVGTAARHLAAFCVEDGKVRTAAVDERQTVAYDLASVSAAVDAARELVAWGAAGDTEAALALAFAADTAADLRARVAGREADWGLPVELLADVTDQLAAGRDASLLAGIADTVVRTGEAGPRHLPEDLEMVRQTFRRFAEDVVAPVAERVHRNDEDIPEEIIAGAAELGCFALSIPAEHGGFAEGGDDEFVSMILVTEELSRASLGAAGSLITRPEIVGTAVLGGGTDEQKARWLPAMASGEKMCAVAVTEPDVGSDVAGVTTTAVRDGDEWVLNGIKTWCTFAGRANLLLVLARTDPDRSLGHRGLSLFLVDKPALPGHAWTLTQEGPEGTVTGRMEARAIATLGYRGMHSFEISIENWRVPHHDLIGEDTGLGRGFYLQMQGFTSGRLQTAARAQGVMQAALEQAAAYASQRHVFGRALADYELTRTKLARMAAALVASRVTATAVARALARGDADAQARASQLKQFACRTAEWVTREALQIHGGYGYAEEYPVSRLFVDARVLSVFEGADEVLALRVIIPPLLLTAATGG